VSRYGVFVVEAKNTRANRGYQPSIEWRLGCLRPRAVHGDSRRTTITHH